MRSNKLLFMLAIFLLPGLIIISCSKDDPEPEPIVKDPEPDPDPDPDPDEEKGWVIDKEFTTNLIYVRHIERLNDGKMIVAADAQVARVNADGSIDTSFPVVETNNVILAMALQADGKILIGGVFTTVKGQSSPYIARINSDGTLDASFTNAHTITTIDPYETFVNSIAVQADGRILAGGSFLARFNTDGSLDGGFDPPQELFTNIQVYDALDQDYVTVMITQSDGKIMIAGRGLSVNVTPYNKGLVTYSRVQNIIRLNADGTVDETFKHTINFGSTRTTSLEHPMISSIVQLSDGSFIVGGRFNSINGYTTTGPTYYLPLGSDGEFTFISNSGRYSESDGSPYTMLRLSDDEILIGRLKRNGVPSDAGCILSFNPQKRTMLPLFWYGKDGDPKVFSEARDMVKDSPNSVIVAGWFVEELSADYDYFSSNDIVTKTRGLLRMVKK